MGAIQESRNADTIFLFEEQKEEHISVPDRISMRLNDELQRIIEENISVTPAKNPTDVIKNALIVYHRLIMEKQAGNEVLLSIQEGENSRTIPVFA